MAVINTDVFFGSRTESYNVRALTTMDTQEDGEIK
jgi:hypothetical protein